MALNIRRVVDFVKLRDLVDLVGMLIGLTRLGPKGCARLLHNVRGQAWRRSRIGPNEPGRIPSAANPSGVPALAEARGGTLGQ
jgi:hypothetical protein